MWLSRAPWRRTLVLLLLSCARQSGEGDLGLRGVSAKAVTHSDAPAAPPTYAQYLNYTVAELQAATNNKARCFAMQSVKERKRASCLTHPLAVSLYRAGVHRVFQRRRAECHALARKLAARLVPLLQKWTDQGWCRQVMHHGAAPKPAGAHCVRRSGGAPLDSCLAGWNHLAVLSVQGGRAGRCAHDEPLSVQQRRRRVGGPVLPQGKVRKLQRRSRCQPRLHPVRHAGGGGGGPHPRRCEVMCD
jgi:hypothetical protein